MPLWSRPFARFARKSPRPFSLFRGGGVALIVAALPGLALAGLVRPACADLRQWPPGHAGQPVGPDRTLA